MFFPPDYLTYVVDIPVAKPLLVYKPYKIKVKHSAKTLKVLNTRRLMPCNKLDK